MLFKSNGKELKKSLKNNQDDINTIIKCMNMLSSKSTLDISGKITPVHMTLNNKELEESWNNMLSSIFKFNELSVLEMNDTLNIAISEKDTQNMMDGVDVQNKELSKMSMNSKEIKSSIKNVSNTMHNISSFCNKADESSNKSKMEVSNTVNFVKQSFAEIQELNDEMESFRNKTKEINTVIDIVKGIADETNMLSLNASIEAARAGESGKGFGVVAVEIRKLSDNTKQSVDNIQNIVDALQRDINRYVEKINGTSDKLKSGYEQMEDTISNVSSVTKSVQEISKQIKEISSHIEQQTTSTENFLQGIDTLSSKSDIIKDFCNRTSKEFYTIGRTVDKVRGRLYRFSNLFDYKILFNTYNTDHSVFMWRISNMLLGYEKLEIEKMNNPNTCKMGIWYNTETNERIIKSQSYKELKNHHENLHKIAEKIIGEYYSGNIETAKSLYNNLQPEKRGIERCLDELTSLFESNAVKMEA